MTEGNIENFLQFIRSCGKSLYATTSIDIINKLKQLNSGFVQVDDFFNSLEYTFSNNDDDLIYANNVKLRECIFPIFKGDLYEVVSLFGSTFEFNQTVYDSFKTAVTEITPVNEIIRFNNFFINTSQLFPLSDVKVTNTATYEDFEKSLTPEMIKELNSLVSKLSSVKNLRGNYSDLSDYDPKKMSFEFLFEAAKKSNAVFLALKNENFTSYCKMEDRSFIESENKCGDLNKNYRYNFRFWIQYLTYNTKQRGEVAQDAGVSADSIRKLYVLNIPSAVLSLIKHYENIPLPYSQKDIDSAKNYIKSLGKNTFAGNALLKDRKDFDIYETWLSPNEKPNDWVTTTPDSLIFPIIDVLYVNNIPLTTVKTTYSFTLIAGCIIFLFILIVIIYSLLYRKKETE